MLNCAPATNTASTVEKNDQHPHPAACICVPWSICC